MQVCDENATILHAIASDGVSDKLQEALNWCLRRVASDAFSPAFQRRDQVVADSRRVATIEFTPISVVAPRRGHFVGLSRP